MNLKTLNLMLAALVLCSGNTFGHDAFKEPMMKRYGLKTVSCKTCHPNNKDKSIHNAFGKLVEKQLVGKDMTKKFNAAKEKGEEAVKEYEKEMVVDFIEAMKVVEKEKMTFQDLLKMGLLNGVRLETKKETEKPAKP